MGINGSKSDSDGQKKEKKGKKGKGSKVPIQTNNTPEKRDSVRDKKNQTNNNLLLNSVEEQKQKYINNAAESKKLSLATFCLISFPYTKALDKLTNLTDLDVSHNRISAFVFDIATPTTNGPAPGSSSPRSGLPNSLTFLSDLKTLDVSYNDFKEIPTNSLPATLAHLKLSHNPLGSVPTEITNLVNLIDLELEACEIQGVLPALPSLAAVKIVKLRHNYLTSFGGDLGKGTLKELDFSVNKITNLPPVASLVITSQLDGSHNEIAELPDNFGDMTLLTHLNLSFNLIGSLPPSFGNLVNLKELYLIDNLIHALPDNFGNLTNLVKLDLSFNKIKELPTSMANLNNSLTYFWFNNNRVSTVDNVITEHFTALQELHLSGNHLKSTPAAIPALTSLKHLSLAFNNLSTFSLTSIVRLTKLLTLGLSGNKISSLTIDPVASISAISPATSSTSTTATAAQDPSANPLLALNISEFWLAGNKLKSVPIELLDMSKFIKLIDLGSNRISALPPTFGKRINPSYWVDLSFNPIATDPAVSTMATMAPNSGFRYDTNKDEPATPNNKKKKPKKLNMVGYADTLGKRGQMEDEILIETCLGGVPGNQLYAVFDGHGGKATAKLLAEHFTNILLKEMMNEKHGGNYTLALKAAFATANSFIQTKIQNSKSDDFDDWSPKGSSGATAVVCLLVDGKIYTANVGDARAVLVKQDNVALRLSEDHKPLFPQEERRVRNQGGLVTSDGRIMGRLAVSRAFGDFELVPYVSCEPHISIHPLDSDDVALVLACDGVWDVLSDKMAAVVCTSLVDKPTRAAVRLRDTAYFSASTDNISCIVVNIKDQIQAVGESDAPSSSSSPSGQALSFSTAISQSQFQRGQNSTGSAPVIHTSMSPVEGNNSPIVGNRLPSATFKGGAPPKLSPRGPPS